MQGLGEQLLLVLRIQLTLNGELTHQHLGGLQQQVMLIFLVVGGLLLRSYNMYKLGQIPLGNSESICVCRLSDNAWIPFDPANTDYQQYLAWLEAGNTPQPADE